MAPAGRTLPLVTNTAGGSAPQQRDQWAAIASDATKADAESAGLPSPAPKPGTPPYQPVHAVIASLLVLSALATVVWLFISKLGPDGAVERYRFPVQDGANGFLALSCLAIAACVLSRGGREFGLALGAAFALCMLAGELHNLNPALYAGSQADPFQWLFGVAELFRVVAGVLCGLASWRARGPAARRPAPRARRDLELLRRQRLLYLLAAIFGVVPLAIGTMVDWESISAPGIGQSYECCTFAQETAWERADIIALPVALAVCVLFAAISGSRARSAGWLLGPALSGAEFVVEFVVEALWPTQSAYGIGAAPAAAEVHVTLLTGFWLMLLGTLVLLAAAIVRARLRSQARPYGPAPTAASA